MLSTWNAIITSISNYFGSLYWFALFKEKVEVLGKYTYTYAGWTKSL